MQERQEFIRKRLEVSEREFVTTGFKAKAKLKHEDPFVAKVPYT